MDASPRSSTHETQQPPAATTDDACYRLIAQIILKETESGRDNKGHVFGLQVWSIQTTPPSIADFDTYVSFKLNKQVIPTEDKLKKRLLKNKNETLSACIDPVSVDRAGAADEQQQQEIVEQLRAYWGEHYEALDATWRM
ncbi:hypothetical protein Ae201684P_015540 [Aphanomyces euteiches]|nr:hypothetical protein Ae201684P_015540 [Aphanomyces euteiches]